MKKAVKKAFVKETKKHEAGEKTEEKEMGSKLPFKKFKKLGK